MDVCRNCSVVFLGLMVGSLFLTSALAYPPAPGFTLYGTVRDEFGWVIDSPDATITFKDKVSKEIIATGKIRSNTLLTENYRVMLPLDHFRNSEAYSPGAIPTSSQFTIIVTVGQSTYLPFITQNSVGAGDFRQLDLALGTDADNDGLPDLWEQWQLQSAGLPSDDLSLLAPNQDIDGDGQSNLDEFRAGTFAYVSSDSLALDTKPGEAVQTWAVFELLGVTSKTYYLERSADLVTWTQVPFGLDQERTNLVTQFTSPDTAKRTIQVSASGRNRWFYRARVQ